MEPIGGQASGVNVPHPSFARGVRRICDRYGMHLVFDEIVTAFRTGRFLAAHHDPDARPDVVVLAKGLGAGYAPLGAFLAPARLVDALAESTGFVVSHSYDANPIACAAGSAVLDEVVDRDLIGNAARMGARMRAGLEAIAAPFAARRRRARSRASCSRSSSSPTARRSPASRPTSIPARSSGATGSTTGSCSTRAARTPAASATGSSSRRRSSSTRRAATSSWRASSSALDDAAPELLGR